MKTPSSNGGQCFGGPDFVPHQEGHGSSTGVELCDCSSAVVQNATSETGLTRHVGQTCQYQVQEREYCHRNSDEYCVNGGQCRNMAHDFDQQPCDCPSGYEGRSCQYTTEQVHADCSLSCNNHGACEHGISPYGSSFDDHMTEIKGPHDLLNLPQEQLTRNFMHCACNHGYAGGQCEFEAVQCGDTSTHYCFHGSSCVVDEKGHDACDCSNPQGKKRKSKRPGNVWHVNFLNLQSFLHLAICSHTMRHTQWEENIANSRQPIIVKIRCESIPIQPPVFSMFTTN